MSLAEDDELIETLVLDGLHEALCVRIAIGALRWDLHALHAPSFENGDERLCEQRISIMDQVARATKKTIHRICQIASHLHRPQRLAVRNRLVDLRRGNAVDFGHSPDLPRIEYYAGDSTVVERLQSDAGVPRRALRDRGQARGQGE